MKEKISLVFLIWFMVIAVSGCALINKPIEFVDEFIGSTFFPPYSGPRAKLVVADFEVMTAKATPEISSSLRDLLISGLTKSQRFQLINPVDVNSEKKEGLIIAASLIDFEPYSSGGKSGIGGGGSASSGTLGSLLSSSVNKAFITLNIRIVDAQTSKVLFSERVSGQAAGDSNPKEEQTKENNLGQNLGMYAGTSMEEAINNCILEAVKYLIDKVPAQYYKGDSKNGKT
jgi:curli biogenesis system outer membrane secretion channel CsgG